MHKKFSTVKKSFICALLLLFTLTCLDIPDTSFASTVNDPITELRIENDNIVCWDSERGPLYQMNLSTGEMKYCTSDEAKIINYSLDGDLLTVEVYSQELPVNATYVLDLTQPVDENNKEDGNIRSYGSFDSSKIPTKVTNVDESQGSNVVLFYTLCGPAYFINPYSGDLLICSDESGKVLSFSREETSITVTVISDMLPCEKTYTFEVAPITDTIERVQYSKYLNIIDFDTQLGPHYKIDLNKGEIIECSADNAQLISYSKAGNIITITVKSDELPIEKTYNFDVTQTTPHPFDEQVDSDTVESCYYSKYKNLIKFDSTSGPYYEINLNIGEIISCTSTNAKLLDYSKKGDIVSVTVYSDELPIEKTYTFDVTKLDQYNSDEIFENDAVEYYRVYSNGTLEFDSTHGPLYHVDYNSGTLLGCTSNAEILKCSVKNNILSLTVYSEEFPIEKTYTFDLTKNHEEANENGAGVGNFEGRDAVDYFNILTYENAIEWDSEYGPYYKVSLDKGKVIYCTSDEIFPNEPKAKVTFCALYGDHITISVYSAELPYEMTYIFNYKTHEQVCGITGFDRDSAKKEADKVIKDIMNGRFDHNDVEKDTADKVKDAHDQGKDIITSVQSSTTDKDRLDEKTRKKIEKALKDYDMTAIQYMDIMISIYADGEFLGTINKLENSIDFTLQTTEEIQNSNDSFYVLRIHDDEVEFLEVKHGENHDMTFETDRFSTYVLVSKNTNQSPDDNTPPVEDTTQESEKDSSSETDSPDTEPSESEPSESEPTNTESLTENDSSEDASSNNGDTNPPSFTWIIVLCIIVVIGAGIAIAIYFIKKK